MAALVFQCTTDGVISSVSVSHSVWGLETEKMVLYRRLASGQTCHSPWRQPAHPDQGTHGYREHPRNKATGSVCHLGMENDSYTALVVNKFGKKTSGVAALPEVLPVSGVAALPEVLCYLYQV